MRNLTHKSLLWLASGILIYSLIYASSVFALRLRSAAPEVDTRSVLTADYGPWDFTVFQPLDQAIIKEIQRERGLPEEIVIPGSFWPALTSVPGSLPAEGKEPTDLESPNNEPTEPHSAGTEKPTGAAPTRIPSTPTQPITSTFAPRTATATMRPSQAPNPTVTPNPTKVPDTQDPSQKSRPPRKTQKPKNTPPPKRTP